MTKHKQELIKGLIIGVVTPIITLLFVRFVLTLIPKFSYFKLISFEDLQTSGSLLSTVLQIGVVGNAFVFFYFLMKNNPTVQKGIVIPTLILTFLAIVFKYYF